MTIFFLQQNYQPEVPEKPFLKPSAFVTSEQDDIATLRAAHAAELALKDKEIMSLKSQVLGVLFLRVVVIVWEWDHESTIEIEGPSPRWEEEEEEEDFSGIWFCRVVKEHVELNCSLSVARLLVGILPSVGLQLGEELQ